MGYLLAVSLAKKGGNYNAINELPKTLPWRVYESELCIERLIDVINYRKEPEYPFTSLPAVQDLPLNFEAPLEELNNLYNELKKKNRANGFKRTILNLNLILSRNISTEVLTLVTDDEGTDFACVSECGALKKLRFRAGKIEVNWSEEGLNMSKNSSSRLHAIAESECQSFTGKPIPIFGFDGDSNALRLKLIASSGPIPPPKPKPPRGGWAAHERRQRELSQLNKKWWQFWK